MNPLLIYDCLNNKCSLVLITEIAIVNRWPASIGCPLTVMILSTIKLWNFRRTYCIFKDNIQFFRFSWWMHLEVHFIWKLHISFIMTVINYMKNFTMRTKNEIAIQIVTCYIFIHSLPPCFPC